MIQPIKMFQESESNAIFPVCEKCNRLIFSKCVGLVRQLPMRWCLCDTPKEYAQ